MSQPRVHFNIKIFKYQMMKNVFCSILILLMATSCQTAPRVIAELTEKHPARSTDSVMIYEVGDSVPAEARAIGTVKCTDGGFTPTAKCLYGNMLALAVKKTAESGGNVLRIDKHKDPSFMGSTCHRIWGTMMVMPDSLVKTDVLTSLQKIELNHDAEYQDYVMAEQQKRKRIYDIPHDVLKLSAGLGWITSELETSYGVYKRKSGFSASADYQHFWSKGLGIGVNYMYYGTSFDDGSKLNIHYIGPSLAGCTNLGKNWIYDTSIGLGYAVYTESFSGYYGGVLYDVSESNSRLGVLFQLGIQYKVSKNIGIGFHVNAFRMSLKRPDGIDTSKYDFYGIARYDAQLGLRFYL